VTRPRKVVRFVLFSALILATTLIGGEATAQGDDNSTLKVEVLNNGLEETWASNGKPNATTDDSISGLVDLLKAQKKFEDNTKNGFINQDVLTDGWKPSLEAYATSDDLVYVFGSMLHEILSNMTFYGADFLLTDVLEIFQLDNVVTADGIMNLMEIGLPSRDEIIVSVRETGILEDGLSEITRLLSEQKNLTELSENPVQAFVVLLSDLLRDTDNRLWKDVSVILGDPLGPALIPILQSDFATNATQDPAAISQRANEIFPRLLNHFRAFGMKNLLYNPYLPSPCLRDDERACPSYMLGEEGEAILLNKEKVLQGEMSEEEFGRMFQEALFRYVDEPLGYDELPEFVRAILEQVFNERTEAMVRALSRDNPPEEKEVEVLESLSAGNYSVEIEKDVLASGFNARTAICLANVSAAMFEFPETTSAWIEGLGLERVGSAFPLAGDLSIRAAVFVDRTQNAVVVGVEGTPYIQTYFLRGLFGWLRNIVQARGDTFKYPCKNSNTSLCDEMAEKYPDPVILNGFAPSSSAVGDYLRPALEKAILLLQDTDGDGDDVSVSTGRFRNAVPDKPKLYFAGHSLGAATAKDLYIGALLRGYNENFSKVTLYSSAGPVTGDTKFQQMIEEMTALTNSSMYQLQNMYDPVPYLPIIDDVDKGHLTALYDHRNDSLVMAEPLPDFVKAPSNIDLSIFAYHSIKSQYLPLARSLVAGGGEDCEAICQVGICGLFKCKDTCSGVL